MYKIMVIKTSDSLNEIAKAIKNYLDRYEPESKIIALSQVCNKEGKIITTIITE